MKANRVECNECLNFTWPHLDGNGMIKENAKCKLGKRVMFRMPILNKWGSSGLHYDDGGYYRYCNDFKAVVNE